MAKIGLGILGGISGKIASVVGGKWKGKNYIRAHVTPANPNTELQIEARTNMKLAMESAKANNEKILKPNFVNIVKGKSLSAINRFIKLAVTGRFFDLDYGNTPWSEGNVTPLIVSNATADQITGVIDADVLQNLNGYASASDKIQMFAGSLLDPMCDLLVDYADGETRATIAAKCKTGMYRILSAKKKTTTPNSVYLFIVAKAANGDCSGTASCAITILPA